MSKLSLVAMALFLTLVLGYSSVLAGNGNGNPHPELKHDTLILHVHPWANGNSINCNQGGHSAHMRADENGNLMPVDISLTMIDWYQIDNDKDGSFDEDPPGDANGDGCPGVCGVDDDGDLLIDEGDPADDDEDGKIDEDGVEPGGNTAVMDCDGLDGDISIQIRDTFPQRGLISTQIWNVRAVGIPNQNFVADTRGEHTYSCWVVEDPDGSFLNPPIGEDPAYSGDEVFECDSETIELGTIDLSLIEDGKAVHTPKNGGKGGRKGTTNFVDITEWFLVDVDMDDDAGSGNPDGTWDDPGDLLGVHIFQLSCQEYDDIDSEWPDDQAHPCPLGSAIWDVDTDKTGRPTIQIFVSHNEDPASVIGVGKGQSKGLKA
jgi:hypothetical protein